MAWSLRTVVVAAAVLFLEGTVFITISLIPPHNREESKPSLELEAVLNGSLSPRRYYARWSQCGTFSEETYTISNNTGVFCLEAATSRAEILVNRDELVDTEGNKISFQSYSLSSDGAMVLLATGKANIWRHSFYASYYIYDVKAGGPARPLQRAHAPQRLALWAPTGHQVAYVFAGNVYVVDADRPTQAPTALTTDGQDGLRAVKFYGIPDWVYEEEVLSTAGALWWSPNGTHLAYLHFNDAQVEETMIPFEEPSTVYPSRLWYRMPKPSYSNPTVQVIVHTVGQGGGTTVPLGSVSDIIGRVQWASNDRLVVRAFNRVQNKEEIVMYDVTAGVSGVLKTLVAPSGWLDMSPQVTFLPSQSKFVTCEHTDGRSQLVSYDYASDVQQPAMNRRVLTTADADVKSVVGWSEEAKGLVFTSTLKGPTSSIVACVSLTGEVTVLSPNSVYASASLSSSGAMAILSEQTPTQPPRYTLVSLTDPTPTTRVDVVRVLEDNRALMDKMSGIAAPSKSLTSIVIDKANDVSCNAYMLTPHNFDRSGHTKYPVLFKVYGGPGSQAVRASYAMSWDNYVAAQGIVVVQCDGRGTKGRGWDWERATYMNLGHYEPLDQINAAKSLAEEPWVDKEHMGLWGWSYGGYTTARAAQLDTEKIFKVKVSVAPVTDWRLYDTIYTERYMGELADNEAGYNASSVLRNVSNFDPSFCLVHGLADDNVQYQNSALLFEQLLAAKKHFATMFYPNRDHPLRSAHHIDDDTATARHHLYTFLFSHLEKYLR